MTAVSKKRSQVSLLLAIVALLPACTSPTGAELPLGPPTMSVINQSTGLDTEIEADSWCVDGLFDKRCAAVDGPLITVEAACRDEFVVALPNFFQPVSGEPLGRFPAEGGGAWPVEVREGTILVRAEGSGRWSQASWTFELTRPAAGC